MTLLRFTFQFPMRAMNRWDEWVGDHSFTELAIAAEAAGFDTVSSTDHPLPEVTWLKGGGHHAFDPFVSLAFMAAVTDRLKVLTMLVVSGYRNPYITAKAAASLDNLSDGRLILGLGAGYQKAEFAVLGASYEDRGARFDSALTAMRLAWTGEVLDHDDPYSPVHGHVMQPPPKQPGGPPLWFGGNSKAAMRRVAEVGDGWMPIEQAEDMAKITKTPALSVNELADMIGALGARRVEIGRPAEFSVQYAPRGERTVEAHAAAVAADLEAYAGTGATDILIESRARSFDDCLAELELYRQIIADDRN
jgi:probable F420-dependent oxidoreductase